MVGGIQLVVIPVAEVEDMKLQLPFEDNFARHLFFVGDPGKPTAPQGQPDRGLVAGQFQFLPQGEGAHLLTGDPGDLPLLTAGQNPHSLGPGHHILFPAGGD